MLYKYIDVSKWQGRIDWERVKQTDVAGVMIRAGYGDIIGKYSCLNDWKLANVVNGEYLCEFYHRAYVPNMHFCHHCKSRHF